MITIENYKYKSWGEKFPNNIVTLGKIKYDKSWKEIIEKEMEKEYFIEIEKFLTKCLTLTNGTIKIYPYPDLLFNAFLQTSLTDIKVVILGQDPYHDNIEYEGKIIPQAMGLSFSVPTGMQIPSSLINIFKNLEKYKHIISYNENNGNLTPWAKQGCLLLNTSLTVQHNYANGHYKLWMQFTNTIIEYISNNIEHIVFVLWGANALDKLNLIDNKKHKIIISSHPSGLSCNKSLRKYKPFCDIDHFGKINKYLIKHNKKTIDWKI